MEVNSQFHVPATLPPSKNFPVLIELEAEWIPEPVWTLWSREKSLAPAGTRTPAVQPVHRQYTDLAIPGPFAWSN
jgi:hypothetical protein